MTNQEIAYWIWFSLGMGVGAEIEPVLSQYAHPQNIFEACQQGQEIPLVKPAQMKRLKKIPLEECSILLQRCIKENIKVLPFSHEYYPEKLREIIDAPAVLYVTGNCNRLNHLKTIAIVGSRRPSAYGVQATTEISKTLAQEGVVVVSGLADGLDSVAHHTVLSQNGLTIAVIATGHDQCYPQQNAMLRAGIEKSGVVISEIYPGAVVRKHFFSMRNRIIAAISDGVCVVEARKSSGTMITAHYAQKYGRSVFSVPGNIFSPLSEGTNQLLQKGAIPCLNANSILKQLGHIRPLQIHFEQKEMQPSIPLSETAQKVLDILNYTPQSMGVLADKTSISAWQLAAALTELELSGKVVQIAGRQYLLA